MKRMITSIKMMNKRAHQNDYNEENSEEEEDESIGKETSSPIKKLTDLKRSFIPELKKVPERKLSPLLDRTERDILWNN